jgi:prefoldin subunit 5
MTTARVPRQRRAPAEKAQEALDIASRRLSKLHAKRRDAEAALRALADELDEAQADVDYLGKNPHLKQKPEPIA